MFILSFLPVIFTVVLGSYELESSLYYRVLGARSQEPVLPQLKRTLFSCQTH